jgi:hypothetical protein
MAIILPKSFTGPTLAANNEANPAASVRQTHTIGTTRSVPHRSSAFSGLTPRSRSSRNCTMICTTIAIPTMVTIAHSIELTMLSRNPPATRTALVTQRLNVTTATGTATHRSERKQNMIVRISSALAVRPNNLPSSSRY